MRHWAVLCLLPTALYAFKLPFSLDFLNTGSSNAVSSEVIPHKIAVIGAGAAGSSAAFWIHLARERSGVAVEVDIYERERYIGGRSTVVYPYNDTTFDPIELGASIFVQANKNLWRAANEFNLEKINFGDDDSGVGFWDGETFVFTMTEGTGLYGWWNSLKAIWRYGISSPKKTQDFVKTMINKWVTLYTPESPRWTNITTLATEMEWTELVAQSAAEYLDLQGVHRRFSREVVEAATRVNYGQNVDEIHALEGACSLAANGASSVKYGNYQIFAQFVGRAGARQYLNTAVSSITQKANKQWEVRTLSNDKVKVYDDIIIAAPFHSTNIQFLPSTAEIAHVPAQPYVHLHVTLLTTTAAQPSAKYFGLAPGATVPQAVLTTYEGARRGGAEPEFNSLTYHGSIGGGREEFVVKIFSKERISDEWLKKMFEGQVGWVYRKEWDAYPKLPPTTQFPPVILASGLYYANAFEPFISTMETQTVASRNIVDLLFQERFGAGICGKTILTDKTVAPNPDQVIMQDAKPTTAATSSDDFVLGFDC